MAFDGVAVRVYKPMTHSDDMSGVVFLHGGGWALGNLGTSYIENSTLYCVNVNHRITISQHASQDRI